MKKNWLSFIFVLLITVFAIAIGIPSLKYNIFGYNVDIRGLDPIDLNSSFVTQYFAFSGSVDFEGGKVLTLDADFSNLSTDNVVAEFDKAVATLYWRLVNAGVTDFQLNKVEGNGANNNKIILRFANSIDINVVQLLLQPGKFDLAFQQRQEPYSLEYTGITNDDVESVRLVSDASCYYTYQTERTNYCIAITFKQDVRSQIAAGLQSAVNKDQTVTALIDGQPVAYQSASQVLNPADPGRELVLAPAAITTNQKLVTSILASLIRNDQLTNNLGVSGYDSLNPKYGVESIQIIKIAEILAVFATIILIFVFYRKDTKPILLLYVLYFIWSVGLFKALNFTLNLTFITGFSLATALFFISLLFMHIRVQEIKINGVKDSEFKATMSWILNRFRNLTIVILLIYLVVNYFGTILLDGFFLGLGAGTLVALIIYMLPAKAILPFLLSKKGRSK